MACNVPLGTPCYSLFARGKLWMQTTTAADCIERAQTFSDADNAVVRERIEYADGEFEQQVWPPATLP